MLDEVVLGLVRLDAALPEQADDLDGLLQQLQPLLGVGPVVAEDALVEGLAGADAEAEAARHERGHVDAAWAMIAGCVRTVGHVTAVIQPMRSVTAAMPPSTAHTKGLWPCASFHGWKWSEIQPAWKPACSALAAASTSSGAVRSSLERAMPILCHAPGCPLRRAGNAAQRAIRSQR